MGTKQEYLLSEAKSWFDEGLIDESTHSVLMNRYKSQHKWDLRTLVRWTLLVGSLSLGIGLITLVTLILDSLGFLAIVLGVGAAGFIFLGVSMGRPGWRVYLPKTGNALVTVGCLLLCAEVFTLAKLFAPDGDHWAILLLVVSILYLIIAYSTKNSAVLIMSLLALASWYGAETGYVSGWGAYFFGMNYPIRFALVTPLVIVVGYLHKKLAPPFSVEFPKVYYSIGLLYFNMSLWILSIYGSSDTPIIGNLESHLELGIYSILWLALCAAMFLIGTRYGNRTFRGFGLTFVAINLYTRYYEYFWNAFDKWIFFVSIGIVTLIAGLLLERYQKRTSVVKDANESATS